MRDKKLLQSLKRAVHKENVSAVEVLELINQVEENGACLRNGYSSTYRYLTDEMKYSEGAAMRRLGAARVMRQYPRVKELLVYRDGKSVLRERIQPVAVKRVVTPCNDGNSQQRGVESKDGRKTNRATSATTAERSATPPPVFEIEERLKMSFSIKRGNFHLVERAKELLSNRFPEGADLEQLFLLGLKELIGKEEKRLAGLGTKRAKAGDPRKRYIPAALRKAVLERDNYQCTYRYKDGTVCGLCSR